VHLPGFALDAGRQAVARLQAEIEVDEILRRADPGDAGDDVQPAYGGAQPLGQNEIQGELPHKSIRRRSASQIAAGLFK
jgi:hypothetical protein